MELVFAMSVYINRPITWTYPKFGDQFKCCVKYNINVKKPRCLEQANSETATGI